MSERTTKKQSADYPIFTRAMRGTHKLLIPQMAPIHFKLIVDVIGQEGYDIEVLENFGPAVVQEGLQYVHNDACYPALLVIGQFIDALKSGRYDVDKTALLITQTGGGCRASNYIYLLRKALVKAGFSHVPVASLNFSGLERNSGFQFTLPMLRKALAACFYGDALMALSNQIKPYEIHPGETMALVAKWQEAIIGEFAQKKGKSKRDMHRIFEGIANDFSKIQTVPAEKAKVGIVGEIYVKYSPIGNNNLEEFLLGENCEINIPGLMGFIQYCIANVEETVKLYGGNLFARYISKWLLDYTVKIESMMVAEIEKHPNLRSPILFSSTKHYAQEFIGIGAKMGEGWLLTGEMAELANTGFPNIVCAQPFGCLPNHIMGKGMISKIQSVYPEANITPIDYDPSATRVNQENRIKLMLAGASHSIQKEEAGHAAYEAEERAAQSAAKANFM